MGFHKQHLALKLHSVSCSLHSSLPLPSALLLLPHLLTVLLLMFCCQQGVVTGVVEGSPEPSAPTANIMNSALYKLALGKCSSRLELVLQNIRYALSVINSSSLVKSCFRDKYII